MTFTKTSQKFGQWSDIRANTVYGLGFASEPELNKVSFLFCILLSLFVKNKMLRVQVKAYDTNNLQTSDI